jgi:hypothetical protein
MIEFRMLRMNCADKTLKTPYFSIATNAWQLCTPVPREATDTHRPTPMSHKTICEFAICCNHQGIEFVRDTFCRTRRAKGVCPAGHRNGSKKAGSPAGSTDKKVGERHREARLPEGREGKIKNPNTREET